MARFRFSTVSLAVASVSLVGAVIIACSSTHSTSAPALSAATFRLTDVPLTPECIARLARVGITPESLALVGATPEQGEAALTLARAFLEGDNRLALRELELRRAQSARANDRHSLALVEAQLASLQNQLFAIASAPFNEPERAALGRLRGNMAWPVPLRYKSANLTKRQWIVLRDAYAAAKTHGQDPDAAISASLRPELEVAPDTTDLMSRRAEDIRVRWMALMRD